MLFGNRQRWSSRGDGGIAKYLSCTEVSHAKLHTEPDAHTSCRSSGQTGISNIKAMFSVQCDGRPPIVHTTHSESFDPITV